MKCHNNNKEGKSNGKHSIFKYMLHMILCCGLPIVIIGLLPVITKISPSTAGVVSRIAPFLCPIMMISMMVMMMGGNKGKSCCHGKGNNDVHNNELSELE